MLTSITQLLTLAAFTAHAVLGCCWHHAHHASDGGCQHPAGQAVVDCCSERDSHTQLNPPVHLNHCHASHSHAHHSVAAVAPPQAHALQAHSPQAHTARVVEVCDSAACYAAAPCDHSHDCEGAHCTYVRIDSSSVPPAAVQPLAWLAGCDHHLWKPFSGVAQAGNRWAYQARIPRSTAPQSCAVLQSWQI